LLERLVRYDSASIELIEGAVLEIAAGRKIPQELIGRRYPYHSQKWGKDEILRHPLIIHDVWSDERFVKFEETGYIRSWLGIPLVVRDKVIGFLNLDSRTPHYFTEEHAALAQTFAIQCAIVIDQVHLFERERRRRETAEAVRQASTALSDYLDLPSLHEAILDWLYKITPYDSASIFEIEGNEVRITAVRGIPDSEQVLNNKFPLSNELCKIINQTGKALILDDCKTDPRFENWGGSDHIRGWMGVPLISRGQVIGYITLDSRTPNAFTQSDAIATQTFAQQAAASLENVRLYTETRKRLEELELVSRVSFALRAARDTNEMLPILLDEIRASVNADTAAILLYDPEMDALIPRAAGGRMAGLPPAGYKPGEGIVGQVYSTGEIRILPASRTAAPENTEDGGLFGAGKTGIIVPIHTASETIGVILAGIAPPRKIESHHIRLIITIAEIAGNAIHRSNLYERSEEQIRRLTTLREMDAAIISSLDLEITLNIITEHLITKMGVSAAAILVFNPNSQMLDYLAASGFNNPEIGRASLSIGDALAGEVLLNRRPLYIKEMTAETSAERSALASGDSFSSYYAVPLLSKGTAKGILETYFRQPFTPAADWLDFLQTLAGQAVIAIDNAQLFESLQRTNQEISLAYDTTLEGWGKALELRDKETQGHTQRVTSLTLELARQMGIPETEWIHIRRGALLHDIGKMGVPDSILRKPGPLTAEEMAEMKNHPQYAFDLLAPIPYLRPALDIPFCHHEWWDGSGYPQGLKGEAIPLAARIFAIIDVWDALLSDRPYRKAWDEKAVRKYIRDLTGKQFDPRVAAAFQKVLETQSKLLRANYPRKGKIPAKRGKTKTATTPRSHR
jgi:HD-GYP domain-containing protein (c-di-GMP phosphodiesterase class II)/putative methionine-R-sulfoxide reductase with GAF domain